MSGYVNLPSAAAPVNYDTYEELPDGDVSAYAKLKHFGVWRDPNCRGLVKPWVPDWLEDWNLEDSLGDDYVPGSPPLDWVELIDGVNGTITIEDGRIVCDSSATTVSYAGIYYDFPEAFDAKNIVVVVRSLTTDPAARLYDGNTVQLLDGVTNKRVKFDSRASNGNATFIVGGTQTVRGQPFAGQTVERVYVFEAAAGLAASDETRVWMLDDKDPQLVAHAGANDFSAASTFDQCFAIDANSGVGNLNVRKLHFAAIYSR